MKTNTAIFEGGKQAYKLFAPDKSSYGSMAAAWRNLTFLHLSPFFCTPPQIVPVI